MSARLEAALHELAEALRDEMRAEAVPAGAPDRLYGIPEAAALLSCGRSLIYTEMQAGRIRALHVGRRVLIPASAIAAYIGAQSDGKGRP